MDHPYYTATVTSVTRGWSYTTTEGEEWDPADAVVLASPLAYTWGWEGEQIPGPFAPVAGIVTLAIRTADDMPTARVGDLITLDVRVGTTGDRIINPTMRVAAVEVELRPRAVYAGRVSLALTDLSVDWTGTPLPAPTVDAEGATPFQEWRTHLDIGSALYLEPRVNTACPAWWDPDEDPPLPASGWHATSYLPDGDTAGVHMQRLLNAYQPGGFTHAWGTVYAPAGIPSGYETLGNDTDAPVIALAVPASRRAPGSIGLPLVFAQSGGMLIVEPRTPAAGNALTLTGLDAAWCTVPGGARQGRESAVNTVVLSGYGRERQDDLSYKEVDHVFTYADAADVAARGAQIRQVDVNLYLGSTNVAEATPGGATLAAAAFLSDASALNAPWTWEELAVDSSLIPQAVAAWLLPVLAPRLPGETNGDARLVRHLTVFNLDADIRITGAPVYGFVTGGQLTIEGGNMLWQFNTTPGLPQFYDAAPAVLLVSEMVTAGSGLTIEDTDPRITIADLAYVDH